MTASRITGVLLNDKFTTVRFNEDGTLNVLLSYADHSALDIHAENVTPAQAEGLMTANGFAVLVKAPVWMGV